MKHISVESIEKAINKVDNLNEDGLEKLAETYALAQQTLLGYIMSAATEYENEHLEGLLIYYYCLLSESFTQEQVFMNQISEDDIDAFEEPFFEMLDQYFDKDDENIINDLVEQPKLTRGRRMDTWFRPSPEENSSKPGRVVDVPTSCSGSGMIVSIIFCVPGMTCGMTMSWKPCCTGEFGASAIEKVRPPDWLLEAVVCA